MDINIWFRRLILVLITTNALGQEIDLLPSASSLSLSDRTFVRQGSGSSARTRKMTLTQLQALIGGGGVTSVFGRTGAIVAVDNDYTLDQLAGVEITSPSTGQMMAFNGTNWVNVTDGVYRMSEIRHTSLNTPLLKLTDVGGSTIAGVEIQNATISGQPTITVNSSSANQAIRIAGKGSSGVRLRANGVDVIDVGSSQTSITSELSLRDNLYLRNAKMLILEDDDELGKVYLKAPTTIPSDYTITMPSSAPSAYSSLTYNGTTYEWRRQNTILGSTVASLTHSSGTPINYGQFIIPAGVLSKNGDALVYSFSGKYNSGTGTATVESSVSVDAFTVLGTVKSQFSTPVNNFTMSYRVVRITDTEIGVYCISCSTGISVASNHTVSSLTSNNITLRSSISTTGGVEVNAQHASLTLEPAP